MRARPYTPWLAAGYAHTTKSRSDCKTASIVCICVCIWRIPFRAFMEVQFLRPVVFGFTPGTFGLPGFVHQAKPRSPPTSSFGILDAPPVGRGMTTMRSKIYSALKALIFVAGATALQACFFSGGGHRYYSEPAPYSYGPSYGPSYYGPPSTYAYGPAPAYGYAVSPRVRDDDEHYERRDYGRVQNDHPAVPHHADRAAAHEHGHDDDHDHH